VSVQEPRQFTPAQVLEAARRAEGEGRGEFALQLYRHLVANHPGSPEALAAQGAMARFGGGSPTSQGVGRTGPPPPPFEPQLGGAFGNPFETPRPGDPALGQMPPAVGYGAHLPGRSAPPAESYEVPRLEIELPEPVNDYRMGRVLAMIVTWLGGIALLAGIGLLPITVFSPKSIADLPLIGRLIGGPGTAAWMMAAGIGAMVAGQLVRALLDQAIATRDLAMITRLEAEAKYGEPGRRARKRRG
jgi:hypothetical protein